MTWWGGMGAVRGGFSQGISLFSYDLEKQHQEKERNVLMSWTTSILAFPGCGSGLALGVPVL